MISTIPPETVEEILLHSDPLDVAAFAQTCRAFRSLTYEPTDQHLWRALYLSQPFDDPRTCVSHSGRRRPKSEIDWKGDLQRIIRARTVLDDIWQLCRPKELHTILTTLLDMVCFVPPTSCVYDISQLSQNLIWVDAFLRKSDLFGQAKWILSYDEDRLVAQLHTHFGLALSDVNGPKRVESRALLYDLRNYTWGNEFGPFLMDGSGRVNWPHIQAVHHDVSMHVAELRTEHENFELTIFPLSLPYTQIIIPEGVDLDQEKDWAGVEGIWKCSFCFCDHRELLTYNSISPSDTLIFEDPDFREEFRTMDAKLHVIETSFDSEHPTRPKIHFAGDIGAHSAISGWITMTPDEQIRWHFVTGDQGQNIWSSEGIQVGGIRSMFGVLGTWTTVAHDHGDPVGPFWLRKVFRPTSTGS